LKLSPDVSQADFDAKGKRLQLRAIKARDSKGRYGTQNQEQAGEEEKILSGDPSWKERSGQRSGEPAR
jgi:hypothetical protein